MPFESEKKTPKIDSATSIEQLQKQLIKNQTLDSSNFPMAIVAGGFAAVIGAIIWAGITYATNYQIGWMAVGIGFLVGISINKIGKGKEIHFGIAGAALSLIGCLLGNLFTSVVYIANLENIGVFDVLFQMDFAITVDIMTETFSPMDLLFYGLAVYYGFKYSIVVDEVVEEQENPAPQPPVQS